MTDEALGLRHCLPSLPTRLSMEMVGGGMSRHVVPALYLCSMLVCVLCVLPWRRFISLFVLHAGVGGWVGDRGVTLLVYLCSAVCVNDVMADQSSPPSSVNTC